MPKTSQKNNPKKKALLGDYNLTIPLFSNIEKIIKEFSLDSFASLTDRQKFERVNKTLLDLIQQAPLKSFLLPAVIDYISRINHKKLIENYTITSFEIWLNQYALLSEDQNYLVRAKIAGKYIPREDFQVFFPIGMNKIHKGTHFVTAHSSPDLDTTIASFWGWLDAFTARVGDGLHIWNLPPGGAPTTDSVNSFYEIFGKDVFKACSQSRTSLTLSSMHFVTQKSLIKKYPHDYMIGIDHQRTQKAVVIIDEQGFYLGDWRSTDIEGVRQIQQALNNCLRWYENMLHINLISLFAKDELTVKDIAPFLAKIFDTKIKICQPAKELSPEQYQHVHNYLIEVLDISKGMEATFGEFGQAMGDKSIHEFNHFRSILQESLKDGGGLFDQTGYLRENRPRIFYRLKEIIQSLDDSIQQMRNYVETLDVALQIKKKVYRYPSQYVTLQADLDEITDKMGSHNHLTVVQPDKKGKLWPLGIIHSKDIRSNILGTVTLRDFCNRDEVKIASYLEVISVIDHHKSVLSTQSAPLAIIGDAQSCNVLVAEKTFQINDKYSLGAMTFPSIKSQLEQLEKAGISAEQARLKQKLYAKILAISNTQQKKQEYFIHPEREIAEYLQFLYAILEDTDLLSKVSDRDISCIVQLLNRLKSLTEGKETEIISIDDIPRDDNFAKKAAKRILQNEDLYSLYGKIYELKEKQIEASLQACAEGKPSDVFSDTKEQNGCCRVGQTKLFANNINALNKVKDKVRLHWLKKAKEVYRNNPEIDLHIHMISTITGAKEVYTDTIGKYFHQDEFWIWIPDAKQAADHLSRFLNAFRAAPELQHNDLEVEFLGPNAEVYQELFSHHFLDIKQVLPKDPKKGMPLAILTFKASTLNSRKGAVTPYLPVLAK